ncbi:hypothetical protein [Actinoplanes sp. NPDC051411]|uniref:hypothetical protein n=1 Tax=Actinoplanes sp. NPDC051411 TaxID=3155522 RepID=UPI00343A8D11
MLRTDAGDAGCGETVAMLDVFAELALVDPPDAVRRHPGISVHLGACDACALDFEGLLALAGP